MIKGVNRHMIEISDTGSPYFERALLVVHSGIDAVDSTAVQGAARDLLQNAAQCGHIRHARRRYLWSRILLATISALLGAALALLAQYLFF